MKSSHPIFSGIIGTSMMTLFSYYVSRSRNKNFKEPKLLAKIVNSIIKQEQVARASGWAMHYAMGILLAAAFNAYWRKAHIKPGLGQMLIAGISSGAFGVGMWKLIFTIHPKPPKTPYGHYYRHLMLAHLAFSAGLVLTSSLRHALTETRHSPFTVC
ncbi:hypothetical protein [Olivibacter sitiensis]|uniref:hypothetical protein n=1 Tax=Olivibacter sitiensis TaxID=376470 RepID=UPI0012F8B0FA|nr:hypothetical protein [Olivibacter sitiensis]